MEVNRRSLAGIKVRVSDSIRRISKSGMRIAYELVELVMEVDDVLVM